MIRSRKKKKGLNLHQGRFKQLASNYDGIRGGGLALYVNNRWCSSSHVKVRTAVRNKHTELLAYHIIYRESFPSS